ncbi:MAG: acyl carrier protein [Deltaproteobacteria bacterium]|nr:acyl carrier protein [Deltaproteobacteria bacterium]
MSEIKEEIQNIIIDVSGFEGQIDPETDLVGKRIIKSVMLLEIISIIEEDYDLEVTAQDVYDGHFKSLNSMVAFVQSK